LRKGTKAFRKETKERQKKEEQAGKKGIVGIKRRRNWDDRNSEHI
jgi:hypothetical protein